MSLLGPRAGGLPVPMVDNPTADFSDDPVVAVAGQGAARSSSSCWSTRCSSIWFERRVVGRMQQRPGPTGPARSACCRPWPTASSWRSRRTSPPKAPTRSSSLLAPIIAGVLAFLAFAVIPLGPTVSDVRPPHAAAADRPAGRGAATSSRSPAIGVYGIVLAGWSSGSTYPLLGGLRSTAQVISYEIAMGLSLVAVFLYAGSMSTSQIVDAADGTCGSSCRRSSRFLVYVVAMVGETNRAPVRPARGRGRAGRRLPHRVLAR